MRRWMTAFAAACVYSTLLSFALGADVYAADAASAFPAQAAPVDLPPNEKAQALIDSEPRVVQARHALEAARHRAEMFTAGPHEWTARAGTQRRRYSSSAQTATEWSAGFERTVRIGGKAALDRRLGEVQLRLAEARVGEARHEAARELLDLWLSSLAAERTRQLWSEQLGFAETSFNAAGTRRKAGDASLLEQNAARADLAEVQRQLSGAANEEAKVRAKLRARFAQLQVETPRAGLSDPVPLTLDVAMWRDRILAESDVLRIAREELQRAELAASRAGADRLADPTIGVHAASEAGGAEKIVGLTLTIPLSGTYRHAQHREALAQVDVWRAAVGRSLRELESEIAESLTDALGSLERWRFAEQAKAATQDNAQLTQRAYSLGEADLQALLLARRQLVDASLGATQARVAALKARYRLLIDAHLIWGLNED